MKLHFNYSIDCELPPNTPYTDGGERRPFFHGPRDWAFDELSVRGFVEQMDSLGVRNGATLFVYPDVAMHQKHVYREMADKGIEVALHLNGLRYSRLKGEHAKWLGEMNDDQQREALRLAKDDLEQAIGRRCDGYRACYGSATRTTFAILAELGFTWASNSSGRYRPEFCANWAGSWPYGHFAHASSNLIPGDLDLYEIPVTRGLTICFNGNADQPLDLRVETQPALLGGESRPLVRKIIEENVTEMDHRDAPVRAIVGASHNTSAYNDRSTHPAQNLDWIVRHACEAASGVGLEFAPATFAEMAAAARRAGRRV